MLGKFFNPENSQPIIIKFGAFATKGQLKQMAEKRIRYSANSCRAKVFHETQERFLTSWALKEEQLVHGNSFIVRKESISR